MIDSELPETQSVFSKVYFWLLTGLSAAGMILSLLATFSPIRLLYGPPWASLAIVVVSALSLLSVQALLRGQEWGLTGFSISAFLCGLILSRSGASLYMSLLPALAILPILAAKVWEESNVIFHTALARWLGYALEQEKLAAAKGLKAFEKFERVNVETSKSVFLAGLIGFPVAYLIAHRVDAWLPRYNSAVVFAIICVLGAGPLAYASYRRYRHRNPARSFHETKAGKYSTFALGTALSVLVLTLADVIQAAWIVFQSAVVLLLVFLPYHLYQYFSGRAPSVALGFPAGMPANYQYATAAVIIIVVTLIYFSDARLFPVSTRRFFRELRLGLARNGEKLFSFVANNILAALLVGTAVRYEVLYTDWLVGVVAYLVSGAMLGYELSRAEINGFLNAIAALGRIRCLLKLKKRIDADFFVYLLRDDFMAQPEPIPAIANLIGVKMMGPAQEGLQEAIEYAEEQLPRFFGYGDLLRDSFALSRAMQEVSA